MQQPFPASRPCGPSICEAIRKPFLASYSSQLIRRTQDREAKEQKRYDFPSEVKRANQSVISVTDADGQVIVSR